MKFDMNVSKHIQQHLTSATVHSIPGKYDYSSDKYP